MARLLDEGTASYTARPPPARSQGAAVDSSSGRAPGGSAADVRAKGIHDGEGWTLEMARKLDTGHAGDAVIIPGRDHCCAIAVLDDELSWNHSVSPLILLRLGLP